MPENIHLLRHEIHSSDTVSDDFVTRLLNITSDYPIDVSQNYHMFIHAMREFNKKLSLSEITYAIDAGRRPENLLDFFENIETPSIDDFIEMENGHNLLQQNGYRLILEQDI